MAAGDLCSPAVMLRALDQAVPDYLASVDHGDLVYRALKRIPTDVDGDLRGIWEQTRIEAIRYVMMVPRREVDLLVDPV